MITGSKDLIRDVNVALVLDTIRRQGPVSRIEVARRTGLSKSTVTGVVERLIRAGLVREVGTGTSAGGRRPILLDLDPSARWVVSVQLAPSQVTVALCDLKARIGRRHVSALPSRSADLDPAAPPGRSGAVLGSVIAAIETAVGQSGVPWERILGIGVAVPGVVDVASGMAVSSHFLTWSRIPLREVLERRFSCPVVVDNDANTMALAEYWVGAGAGSRCFVGVTVGVGIGSGIVIEGRLFRGAIGGAGEIGHIPIEPDGPLCSCGRRGCLEAVAGDQGIVRVARELGLEAATREEVVEAARRGDPRARRSLEWAAGHIGRALATVVNLLNPDVIVLGGEATLQAGPLLLDPVRESMKRHAFEVLGERVEVRPPGVRDNPYLIGAGIEILETLFRLPWGSVPGVEPVSQVAGALGRPSPPSGR